MSDVSVVVVTHNGLPWVEQAFASVRGVEAVLVDNASTDGTVALVRERFPEAYDKYSANVPAFVPRVTPWKDDEAEAGGFSFDLYMRHGEWKAGITYLLVMGWLALRMTRGF